MAIYFAFIVRPEERFIPRKETLIIIDAITMVKSVKVIERGLVYLSCSLTFASLVFLFVLAFVTCELNEELKTAI